MKGLADYENSVYLPYRKVDSAHFIDVFMREGGYSTLFKANAGEELTRARFLTRFGLQLETYWKRMVLAPTRSRALIANLATLEPGMFMTRRLVARNPHGLIEGMLLAARASGADAGIIVTPVDDHALGKVIERALLEAKNENMWGDKASWACDLKQVYLPTSALYGDDSFLLSALHGLRPAYPNQVEFLFGDPVHIHRPEEFYAFSWIERFGAETFAKKGSPATPGVYLVNISGNVPKPIVVEIPGATPLVDVLELSGLKSDINSGWFRWGGVLGKWHLWEEIKNTKFELHKPPFLLKTFQYPSIEWFSGSEIDIYRQATGNFVSNQSCGACIGCSQAKHGILNWSTEERVALNKLSKCSFLPLAINSYRVTHD